MTFDDNDAKKFVHRMIRWIETLTQENLALRSILRSVTPAMEAGITDHVWSLRELLSAG
jgi:hypothetical protein